MPERARIILAGLPRLLEEILVAAVAAEPDVVVTATVRDPRSLGDGVTAVDADVVITGDAQPDAVVPLLELYPHLKVLAFGGGGESSWLYETRLVVRPLGQLSPDGVVAAVLRATEPVPTDCGS